MSQSQMPSAEPAIVAEHLTKTYGQLRALDDLTLAIRSGETFGLIGPNGSGKTTLIRVLLGLLRPTSGNVRVLGRHTPSRRVARSIGYMTQSSALYNVRGKRLRARIDATIALVDLADRLNAPVTTLSGGMRQRVSLGCALIHEPRLLFLDEPTVGIDPELRVAFWDYFERLNAQGVTLVVSTHYLDEARRCHRLALLRFGKLLAVDTPEALRREAGEEDFERAFLYFARREEPAGASASA